MPETKQQVLFAEEELTIHKKLTKEPYTDTLGNENWQVESAILLPGSYISVDELPPYLIADVRAKRVKGAKLTTESNAKKVAKKAKELRDLAGQAKVVVDKSSTIDADSIKLASDLLEIEE